MRMHRLAFVDRSGTLLICSALFDLSDSLFI